MLLHTIQIFTLGAHIYKLLASSYRSHSMRDTCYRYAVYISDRAMSHATLSEVCTTYLYYRNVRHIEVCRAYLYQCFFRRRWRRRKFSSMKRFEFSLTRLKLWRKVGDLRQNDDDDDDKSRIFVNETLTITKSNEWRKVITETQTAVVDFR